MSFADRNRQAWDSMVARGSLFAKTATDDEVRQPLKSLDGRGWLPASVVGMDVLCLAAGGGWQSILYAAAGARVTVMDLSPAMLEQDSREAERRRLAVRIVEGSMLDLSMFDEASFDIVHQPVSTCYVPDVEAVYRQIARVARDGALYISQHKQPTSLQIVGRDARDQYQIGVRYYHQGPLPAVGDDSYREPGAVEFLHRWENLVGGLCRNGFSIEDLREPYRGDESAQPGHFKHRGLFVAPYLRIKARRLPRQDLVERSTTTLWTPE